MATGITTDTHTTRAREGFKLGQGSRNNREGWIVYNPASLRLSDRVFASKRSANRFLLRWITFRTYDVWASKLLK